MKYAYSLIFLLTINIAQPAFTKEIGLVMVKNGKATLAQDSKAKPARVGNKVHEGDTIETNAKSYVKLVMHDRNILVISENTKLKIESYNSPSSPKTVLINLVHGSVRHKLEQKYADKSEKYEVVTPTAIAGVRGTDFIVEYDHKLGHTIVSTIEGSVHFDLIKNGSRENNPQVIPAGHFIHHKNDETHPKPTKAEKTWLDEKIKKHSEL